MKFWDWFCSCFKGKKSTEDDRAESRDSSIDSETAATNVQRIINKGLIPDKETGTLFNNYSTVDVSVTDNGSALRESGDLFNHRDSE